MIKNVLILIMAFTLFIECEKEPENNGDPSQEFVYESLEAELDVISAGATTSIKATASGYDLSYHWAATAGDILGSGPTVTYAASPCHVGENKVSCTLSDGNGQSETKTVTIVVQ